MNKQITSMAGEYFVAAELSKRGFQVALTLKNAKSIDMIVHHEQLRHPVTVEVKTHWKGYSFKLSHEILDRSRVYVFVVLKKLDEYPVFSLYLDLNWSVIPIIIMEVVLRVTGRQSIQVH